MRVVFFFKTYYNYFFNILLYYSKCSFSMLNYIDVAFCIFFFFFYNFYYLFSLNKPCLNVIVYKPKNTHYKIVHFNLFYFNISVISKYKVCKKPAILMFSICYFFIKIYNDSMLFYSFFFFCYKFFCKFLKITLKSVYVNRKKIINPTLHLVKFKINIFNNRFGNYSLQKVFNFFNLNVLNIGVLVLIFGKYIINFLNNIYLVNSLYRACNNVFRFFFYFNLVISKNKLNLSFFLIKTLLFVNKKKTINSGINFIYIPRNNRLKSSFKYFKLFFRFSKKIYFAKKIAIFIQYIFFNKTNCLAGYTNFLFLKFNNNLKNKIFKNNLIKLSISYNKNLSSKSFI